MPRIFLGIWISNSSVKPRSIRLITSQELNRNNVGFTCAFGFRSWTGHFSRIGAVRNNPTLDRFQFFNSYLSTAWRCGFLCYCFVQETWSAWDIVHLHCRFQQCRRLSRASPANTLSPDGEKEQAGPNKEKKKRKGESMSSSSLSPSSSSSSSSSSLLTLL